MWLYPHALINWLGVSLRLCSLFALGYILRIQTFSGNWIRAP
jgi:hypothetical protein